MSLTPKAKNLGGGMVVRRALPAIERRTVGPFVFFDHMGPAHFEPGQGLDVRPHPHIGISTVTYLFDGEIMHHDSLDSHQAIQPGAINWMVAGRGIVHSERKPVRASTTAFTLHGIQLWVALPKDKEEMAPSFSHHPGDSIPTVERPGATLRVLLGRVYGVESPVPAESRLFYVHAELQAGAELEIPADFDERAVYLVEGALRYGEIVEAEPQMLILADGSQGVLQAATDCRVMLLGGDRLEGKRHLWWNFVSSSKARIEEAKADWKAGRHFEKIPGDDVEFIPLPEY
ncbi:MAG: pirin family protein [Myxococcota bacterium]